MDTRTKDAHVEDSWLEENGFRNEHGLILAATLGALS